MTPNETSVADPEKVASMTAALNERQAKTVRRRIAEPSEPVKGSKSAESPHAYRRRRKAARSAKSSRQRNRR